MDDLEWATGTLADLVATESPSGDTGRIRLLAAQVSELLDEVGAATEIQPDGHLLGRCTGGEGPPVLILGHLDTVWPVGRLAEAPFTVDGELATGPGVFDMKGGLVALVLALRAIRAGTDRLCAPLRILLTADEEIGSPSGGHLVRAQAAGCRAVFALEPPLAEGALKVGRRGVARVRIDVTGREAHAGLDRASGVSAIDELVDHLVELRATLPASDAQSVNAGTVTGGTRANVVAGSATAELGLRFADPVAERAVFDAVEALRPIRAGAWVSHRVLSHRPAWEPTGSQALSEHVRSVARELGQPVRAGVSPGAGDANITGALGIPTVDGLGPRGHGAHAPDETVELPSILERARLLTALLTRPLPD